MATKRKIPLQEANFVEEATPAPLPVIKLAPRPQPAPAPEPDPKPLEKPRPCGVFRKVKLSDGMERWTVELFHAHTPGDRVWIYCKKAAQERQKILLGESIPVSQGDKQLPNFFLIEREGIGFRPQPVLQPLMVMPTNAKPSTDRQEWN